jgi:hypothetical protein
MFHNLHSKYKDNLEYKCKYLELKKLYDEKMLFEISERTAKQIDEELKEANIYTIGLVIDFILKDQQLLFEKLADTMTKKNCEELTLYTN